MKIKFEDGKMKVKDCTEDLMLSSELNLSVLKEPHNETREIINGAWERADIIEVSKQELEFLLDQGEETISLSTMPRAMSIPRTVDAITTVLLKKSNHCGMIN